MYIKSSIFRKGSERLRSKWTLRFRFEDDNGRPKERSYQFDKRIDAVDARPRIEADLKKTYGRSAKGEKMKFSELAEYAKATFYQKAVIVEGRKIDGVRSHGRTMTMINTLTEYFGKKRLMDITRGDLSVYKAWRIKLGDRRGKGAELPAEERKPIRLSSVNRELATLRHMLKNALAEGWLTKDVFAGSKAIDKDAETARTRTLTASEESLLLASCGGGKRSIAYIRKGKPVTADINEHNPYLRAIILLALDSAMRRGEILKLNWEDLDFEIGIIQVRGTHTKTQRSRITPLTERVKRELETLPNFGAGGNIFPFADFKKSWQTALKLAEINGLTFHDLRRTAITRMQMRGVAMGIAAEIAGHARLETTQRHYTSTDDVSIIRDVAARINTANEERVESWPDNIE